MHAVVISEPGGPDVLRWAEVPDPVPAAGEVVIEVASAGAFTRRRPAPRPTRGWSARAASWPSALR